LQGASGRPSTFLPAETWKECRGSNIFLHGPLLLMRRYLARRHGWRTWPQSSRRSQLPFVTADVSVPYSHSSGRCSEPKHRPSRLLGDPPSSSVLQTHLPASRRHSRPLDTLFVRPSREERRGQISLRPFGAQPHSLPAAALPSEGQLADTRGRKSRVRSLLHPDDWVAGPASLSTFSVDGKRQRGRSTCRVTFS